MDALLLEENCRVKGKTDSALVVLIRRDNFRVPSKVKVFFVPNYTIDLSLLPEDVSFTQITISKFDLFLHSTLIIL